MPQRTLRSIVAHQKVLATAQAKTTVGEAARLLRQTRVGALLVVEHSHLVGIFTERDALFRLLAEPVSYTNPDVVHRQPLTPSGPPRILASTRWMMFSARSCSPAEIKILEPVSR